MPGVFGGQHRYVTVPWQVHELSPSKYVAAVDIYDEVGEKDETNNSTKPFSYVDSGPAAPPPLAGPAFEAFQVKSPSSGDRVGRHESLTVEWYPTQQLKSLPAAEHSEFWELEIRLVDAGGGAPVAKLAEGVMSKPVGPQQVWRVDFPGYVAEGTYRIMLLTPSGRGWGKSDPFTIYVTPTAQMKGFGSALSAVNSGDGAGRAPSPAALQKIDAGHKPVNGSMRVLDAKISLEPRGAGQPKKVKGVEVRYEIVADQAFILAGHWSDMDGDPANAYLKLYPTFGLNFLWLPPGEDPLGWTKMEFFGATSASVLSVSPPDAAGKVFPKGASILTVTYHLGKMKMFWNDYPNCPIRLKSSGGVGSNEVRVTDLDFFIKAGAILTGKNSDQGSPMEVKLIHQDSEPREVIWVH